MQAARCCVWQHWQHLVTCVVLMLCGREGGLTHANCWLADFVPALSRCMPFVARLASDCSPGGGRCWRCVGGVHACWRCVCVCMCGQPTRCIACVRQPRCVCRSKAAVCPSGVWADPLFSGSRAWLWCGVWCGQAVCLSACLTLFGWMCVRCCYKERTRVAGVCMQKCKAGSARKKRPAPLLHPSRTCCRHLCRRRRWPGCCLLVDYYAQGKLLVAKAYTAFTISHGCGQSSESYGALVRPSDRRAVVLLLASGLTPVCCLLALC